MDRERRVVGDGSRGEPGKVGGGGRRDSKGELMRLLARH